MYIDKELNFIKDMEINAADKGDSSWSYDGRNGVRAIRISPDGKHIASGDRSGNIRIHELSTFNQTCLIEAHDAEVLYLEYSRPDGESESKKLLASASRDRLIHVFDVDEDYNFIQTLDDHSSSITAVRFINSRGQLQMVSCGADKSIIFRQLQKTSDGAKFAFSRGHNVAGKTTLYDMEVDITQKHILTACQDRNIRVYNVNSGKHSKSFKGSVGEDGSLIKVVLDASGIFVATSSTDKTLCIYDYYSGECMATMTGHSELVTGLRFTNDCQRLISASGDGCIFVWTIPRDMVTTMHARLSQQAARAARHRVNLTNGLNFNNNNEEDLADKLDNTILNEPLLNYRLNDSPLPLWAKSQRSENESTNTVSSPRVEIPKGRWAQRLDATGLSIKSVFDSDSIIQCPLSRDCSDNSKEDSSVDSGAETSHSLYPEIRKDSMTPPSKISMDKVNHQKIESNRVRYHTDDSSLGSFKYYEDNESTEHDGDVEDYSEGELTESENNKKIIYYPVADDTHSEFTVNAMDKEELRRSQRRINQQKRPDKLIMSTTDLSSRSISGSQESDDDDDEGSTPGANNADRTLTSSLMNSEPEDGVSLREKYLKNTFESLSGAELDPPADDSPNRGKTSLSSMFHNGPSPTIRNIGVIQAAIEKKNDIETLRKREELQRRIEETRRKLQSVGVRSNLKNSQSTTDLSRTGYNEISKQPRKISLTSKHIHPAVSEESSSSFGGGIRRACSLSDLVTPAPPRQRSLAASGKVNGNTKFGSRSGTKHGSKSSTSNMMRSSSVGVLNQSDSESDVGHKNSGASRIMRPTIASQNKAVSTNFSARRRGITTAYSSMTLYQGNEDSSSEEAPVGKNSVRPRSASIDRANVSRRSSGPLGRSESEQNLMRSAKSRSRNSDLTKEFSLESKHAASSKDIVSSVADQLTRTTDNLHQLPKLLASEQMDPNQKGTLIASLQGFMSEIQKALNYVESGAANDISSPKK